MGGARHASNHFSGLKLLVATPIGASGARVLVMLIYEMIRREGKRGIAARCFVEVTP
jgi:acetyl-CoA acetyltransferase